MGGRIKMKEVGSIGYGGTRGAQGQGWTWWREEGGVRGGMRGCSRRRKGVKGSEEKGLG